MVLSTDERNIRRHFVYNGDPRSSLINEALAPEEQSRDDKIWYNEERRFWQLRTWSLNQDLNCVSSIASDTIVFETALLYERGLNFEYRAVWAGSGLPTAGNKYDRFKVDQDGYDRTGNDMLLCFLMAFEWVLGFFATVRQKHGRVRELIITAPAEIIQIFAWDQPWQQVTDCQAQWIVDSEINKAKSAIEHLEGQKVKVRFWNIRLVDDQEIAMPVERKLGFGGQWEQDDSQDGSDDELHRGFQGWY